MVFNKNKIIGEGITESTFKSKAYDAIDQAEARAKEGIDRAEWKAKSAVDSFETTGRAAVTKIAGTIGRAKDQAAKLQHAAGAGVDQVHGKIKRNPLLSTTVAFGLGMIAARLIAGGRKDYK